MRSLFLFIIGQLLFPLTLFAVYVQNQIEVLLKLEDTKEAKLERVSFNNEEIALAPSNIFRPRAEEKVKLYPGSYYLVWTTKKETIRRGEVAKTENKKLIVIERTDFQVHMHVQGNNLSCY